MKQYDRETRALLNALGKYKLTSPVSKADQKRMLVSKKRLYKRILKTLGLYSVLNAVLVSFYFYIKKTGLRQFILRIVAGILTVAAVSGGIYYLVSRSKEVTEKVQQVTRIAVPESALPVQKKAPAVSYTLGITPLHSTSADRALVDRTARSLHRALNRLKGKHYAVISGGKQANYRYRLSLSIEKMENSYFVYIKVVDRKNSSIIHVEKAGFRPGQATGPLCRKMARGISTKIH